MFDLQRWGKFVERHEVTKDCGLIAGTCKSCGLWYGEEETKCSRCGEFLPVRHRVQQEG